MEDIPQSIRRLSQQLLALEAAAPRATDAQAEHEVVRVCEKLRISVTRFAGADGFSALRRRALALAQVEIPALRVITLKPDCSMEGFEALSIEETDGGRAAATALVSYLLGLLVTFIGEPFVLRLVREAWPDISLVE